MKILHLNEFGSLVGGAETYIFRTANLLSQRGNENILVYGNEVPGIESEFSGKKYCVKELTYRYKEFDDRIINSVIAKEAPDIIYFHQVFHSELIEKLAHSFPTAAYIHGFSLTCPESKRFLKNRGETCNYPMNFFCQWRAYTQRCMPRNPIRGVKSLSNTARLKRAFEKVAKLIVPSNYLKDTLIKNGFKEKKIEVIPYFTFLPDLTSDATSVSQQLLFVGRLVEAKGVKHFIKVLASINSRATGVIIGTGESLNEVKSLACNLRVEFKGYMNYEAIAEYYRRAAVLVIPSIYPETFGIVGIEAGSFAKPVVAFNVGGVSEWLVDGENGFLIKPYDIKEMANKIDLLLKDKELAENMGNRGREIVAERFSPDVHLNKLLQVFDEIR